MWYYKGSYIPSVGPTCGFVEWILIDLFLISTFSLKLTHLFSNAPLYTCVYKKEKVWDNLLGKMNMIFYKNMSN